MADLHGHGTLIALNIFLLVLIIIFSLQRNQDPYQSGPVDDCSYFILIVLYLISLFYLLYVRLLAIAKAGLVLSRPSGFPVATPITGEQIPTITNTSTARTGIGHVNSYTHHGNYLTSNSNFGTGQQQHQWIPQFSSDVPTMARPDPRVVQEHLQNSVDVASAIPAVTALNHILPFPISRTFGNNLEFRDSFSPPPTYEEATNSERDSFKSQPTGFGEQKEENKN